MRHEDSGLANTTESVFFLLVFQLAIPVSCYLRIYLWSHLRKGISSSFVCVSVNRLAGHCLPDHEPNFWSSGKNECPNRRTETCLVGFVFVFYMQPFFFLNFFYLLEKLETFIYFFWKKTVTASFQNKKSLWFRRTKNIDLTNRFEITVSLSSSPVIINIERLWNNSS